MATFDNWVPVFERLTRLVGAPTPEQVNLAEFLGVEIDTQASALVALATLSDAVDSQLCSHQGHRRASPGQLEILAELGDESDGEVPEPRSRREAEAWLLTIRYRSRIKALQDKQPNAGDFFFAPGGLPVEVSSVGDDGCVHMRGGGGLRSWPDLLEPALRSHEATDDLDVVVQARNYASDRKMSRGWSESRFDDLAKYKVDDRLWSAPPEVIYEDYSTALQTAEDERPMQMFLEKYPEALAALLGAGACYVIPRPRLAGELEPDFLLAQVDSDGPHWTYVELESPTSKIFLANGKDLAKNARRGVAQILEWRTWVKENRDKARRPRAEGGYGFAGLEPEAPGIVVVGRRDSLIKDDRLRGQVRDGQNIVVRTYDGLLDSLRQAVDGGPVAWNPALIRNYF